MNPQNVLYICWQFPLVSPKWLVPTMDREFSPKNKLSSQNVIRKHPNSCIELQDLLAYRHPFVALLNGVVGSADKLIFGKKIFSLNNWKFWLLINIFWTVYNQLSENGFARIDKKSNNYLMSCHIQLCSFQFEQKYPGIILVYIARTKYTNFTRDSL